MDTSAPGIASTVRSEFGSGGLRLVFAGRLDAESTGRLWPQVDRLLASGEEGRTVVDASGVIEAREEAAAASPEAFVAGWNARVRSILAQLEADLRAPVHSTEAPAGS